MGGLADVPEHLVDLLIDCPARAAVRVFDAAIDQRVDFVLLAGGVIDPRACAPREWLLLVEQFERLADRNITVYWAGGPSDLVDTWPKHMAWPANVRILPRGKVQRLRHEIAGEPICEIIGRSSDADGAGEPQEYAPSRANLFALAVAHANWGSDALASIGVDYWALGGRHERHALRSRALRRPLPWQPARKATRRIRAARLHARIGRPARASAANALGLRRGAVARAAAGLERRSRSP